MKFGNLEMNPALSPGVLDTATWDREAAWNVVQAIEDGTWLALVAAAASGAQLPATQQPDALHAVLRLAR